MQRSKVLSLTHLDGDKSVKERNMFAAQGPVQGIENARLILVLIVMVVAYFWRMALRVLFAITLVAAAVGAFVLLHGL